MGRNQALRQCLQGVENGRSADGSFGWKADAAYDARLGLWRITNRANRANPNQTNVQPKATPISIAALRALDPLM